MGLKNKIHAIFHLLNSAVFPLLLLAAIASVPLLLLKQQDPVMGIFYGLGFIFIIGFAGLSMFYWVAAKSLHPEKTAGYFVLYYPLFLSLSMGLSFQNTVAVLEGFFGIRTEFVRTPKFNIRSRKDHPVGGTYLKKGITWQNLVEVVLCLYFLGGVLLGFVYGDFGLVFFHLLLASGFAGVSFYSLKPEKTNA
jgi:hypothetical protein